MSAKFTNTKDATALATEYSTMIRDKVILVTGVSPGGLGEEYCFTVAKYQPKMLILASRNADKLNATRAKLLNETPNVTLKTLVLDLESIAKAEEAAETVMHWDDVPHIDIVVNNAGIMAVDYGLTDDGFERQLAVNYLSSWVFTNTLVPKVLKSKEPRIIFVGSNGHRWSPMRWDDYNFANAATYNRWQAYGQSKTAVSLYAQVLAEKLGPKAQVFSLDPGIVMTSLGAHIDWAQEFDSIRKLDLALGNKEAVDGWPDNKYTTKEAGVATYMFASFGDIPSASNGAYLADCRVVDPHNETLKSWAVCKVEKAKLWEWTQRLVGKKFNM